MKIVISKKISFVISIITLISNELFREIKYLLNYHLVYSRTCIDYKNLSNNILLQIYFTVIIYNNHIKY